jgi:hypothetical protein
MRKPEKWMPPMQAEFDQLEARGMWKRVDLPAGERTIDRMWVYDLKVDGDGNVIKRKARYVACRDKMIEGKDFEVKWVMVAWIESVRMVFAVVAVKGLHLRQWDFSGAYLNGVMDKPVYMCQPQGLTKQGEGAKCVCCCDRSTGWCRWDTFGINSLRQDTLTWVTRKV